MKHKIGQYSNEPLKEPVRPFENTFSIQLLKTFFGRLPPAPKDDCCEGFERSDGATMHADECPEHGADRA